MELFYFSVAQIGVNQRQRIAKDKPNQWKDQSIQGLVIQEKPL